MIPEASARSTKSAAHRLITMLNTFHSHIGPQELITAALSSGASELEAAWGTAILLVQVDDPRSALAEGLAGAPPEALVTGTLQAASIRRGRLPEQPTVAHVPSPSLRPQEAWPESLLAQQLKSRLVRAMHYARRIDGRGGRALMRGERYSIGRSADSSLVLAATSVSKTHAWIRKGDDGRLELADNGSRNGTTVNGVAVSAQRTTPITPGDVIAVGGIEIMLCPIGAVWTVIRGG